MATNSPFDFSSMFKMFDPEDVRKIFDPKTMFAVFETPSRAPIDLNGVVEANRKNFEAMVEANKSAAAAYQDLLEKQMDVFGQLTTAAREHVAWLDDTSGPEILAARTKAYGEAVETALGLMRQLADNVREANEEAFAAIKDQVTVAVDDMAQKMQPQK